MTAQEYIAQLEMELARERAKTASVEAELAAERAENASLRQQMEQVLARLREVEGQLAKDSHTSHKPPSSDGLGRKRRSQRQRSEKKTGGQPGHAGKTLMQVAHPDEVLVHRPVCCGHCQQPLEGVAGRLKERAPASMNCHRCGCGCASIRWKRCAAQHASRRVGEAFRQEWRPRYSMGPTCKPWPSLCISTSWCRWHARANCSRTCATVRSQRPRSWCGCEPPAQTLEPTVKRIADWISVSRVQHGDETGIRIGGKLHWMHVNSTPWLTHLAWHAKRGKKALDAIGIWSRFEGRGMHDRFASYDQYSCQHSVCGAHLVRDCLYLSEHEEQLWAQQMHDLLLDMHAAAQEWRQQGAECVPALEREEWLARYFEILAAGFAAQPPPSTQVPPKQRGRPKQSPAKNLLDDLLRRAEQVLAFLDDLSLPFTNNQAERDLRMVKVQQKIAGTFRTEGGATAFCHIRSYLSTMRKQGQSMLVALAAVFTGQPLPVAWAPR